MVRPTITYNATSGSSSASGTRETLITGSSATVSGGDPGTVIALDGSPDLSGLTVDESAIWLSGIGLYRITAIDDGADTVTIHASVSLGGGVSWGIGGIRDNPRSDSFSDEDSAEGAWTWEFQNGTYDMSSDPFSPPGGSSSLGVTTVRAAAGHSPTLTYDGDNYVIYLLSGHSGFIVISGLRLDTQNGSNRAGIALAESDMRGVYVRDCTFTSSSGTNPNGIRSLYTKQLFVTGCTFDSTLLYGISCFYETQHINIHSSSFAADYGILLVASVQGTLSVFGSVFLGASALYGVACSTAGEFAITVDNSVFYDLSQAGFRLDTVTNTGSYAWAYNSVFDSNNSAFRNALNTANLYTDHCAFYNNTYNYYLSGAVSGNNNIELGSSPLVNPAAGDFTLNSTLDGGALCRDQGLGIGSQDIGLRAPNPGLVATFTFG